jgi:hypothetical protein
LFELMSEKAVDGPRRLAMQSLTFRALCYVAHIRYCFSNTGTPLPLVWHLSSVEPTEPLRAP